MAAADVDDWRASPARIKNLTGLPPALCADRRAPIPCATKATNTQNA